ncbi:hypothetical protein [Parvicella tangerina]|uniref:Uncharacterized protein n=1 Tax=Parvicella tangerina TaxID=2829795 RepID=A0A916JMS6_9FLAO|nr:hypothetical protein [Parvicella tangerina]CAG5082631.1 hypothetical protein CRYO30217_01969 [Parvicella tangerina]
MKTLLFIIFVASSLSLSTSEASTKKVKGNVPAYYRCGNAHPIDRTLFTPERDKVQFIFDQDKYPDTTDIGFVNWFQKDDPDYFTAYLVNTTDTTFNAERQDGSLIMIQEAQNKEGDWQPIEYWIYSGCGNSYFNPLVLEPHEYAEVAIVKYHGKFETKMRLKFKYDKNIMYSQPFNGSINLSQFEKETDDVYGILYSGPANYLDAE